MKVFEESWTEDLERKYHCASKYTTPFIAKLAIDPILSKERAKIEERFQTLPDDVKPDILGRLRSTSSYQHFSAYYELVLSEFFKSIGYSITIHPKLKEGEPDLLVTGKNLDKPIIIEVATVFDDPEWEKEERKLDLILEQLDKIEHYFFVMIAVESEPIPERVDYERLQQFVIQWLDSFDPKTTHESQETRYKSDGLKLKVIMIPRKIPERKPIVGSYMLPARFVNSTQLRRVLQKKINKYKSIKELGLPFIIALALAGISLDEEAIIGELFGKMQLTIKRNQKGEVIATESGRDFSGLVTPKPGLGGKAQNRRLSAMLEVRSKWLQLKERNGGEAREHFFRLIHNPFASVPLDRGILKGYPQLVPVAEDKKQISLQWVGENTKLAFN
jgi:hypothetical protein